MLEYVGGPFSLQGAIGQYTEVVQAFRNDSALSGKNLKVNVGLWMDTEYTPPTGLPTAGYQLNYPFSPGTYPMGNIPGANSQTQINAKVTLIVEDSKNFSIVYGFMHNADINDFQGTGFIPPLDRLMKNSVSSPTQLTNTTESVYNSYRALVWHVGYSNGTDTYIALKKIAYTACFWGKGLLDSAGIPVGTKFVQGGNLSFGLSAMEDTEVTLLLPSNLNIGHKCHVGFFRTDNLSGGNWYSALKLSYAELTATPATVGIYPNTAISGGTGFVNTGSSARAKMTIDHDFVDANGVYRIFVAFQSNNVWYSWISPELSPTITSGVPQGDTRCEVTIVDPINGDTVIDSCCVSGLQPGQDIKLCVYMDKASYNADIILQNAGGSFNGNFQGGSIYIGTTTPIPGQIPSGDLYTPVLVDSGSEMGLCIELTVPDSWNNATIWAGFVFNFTYYLVLEERYEQIIQFIKVVGGSDSTTVVFDGMSDGTDPIYYVCHDYTGTIALLWSGITFSDFDTTVFVHLPNDIENPILVTNAGINDGTDYTLTLTNEQIQLLPIGEEVCFTLVSTAITQDDDPIVQDCYDVDMTMIGTFVNSNSAGYNVGFDFSSVPNVDTVSFVIDTGYESGILINFTTNVGEFSLSTVPITSYYAIGTAEMQITIVTDEGFVYSFCVIMTVEIGDEGGVTELEAVVDICSDECQTFSLEDSCDIGNPGLLLECVEAGSVTITATGTTSADTDVIEYSLDFGAMWDPYVGPIEITEDLAPDCTVYARRSLTYTGCPNVEVYEYLDFCCPVEPCPEVTCEPVLTFDEEADTLEIDFECDVEGGTAVITYSINEGVDYDTYTVPIDVTGIEEVLYIITISFEGCEDVVIEDVWAQEGENNSLCESEPTLVAEYFNGSHTATGGGTTFLAASDVIEYSIDGGSAWTVGLGPVVGHPVVLWRRIVTFTNDCETITLITVSFNPCCTEGSGTGGGGIEDIMYLAPLAET